MTRAEKIATAARLRIKLRKPRPSKDCRAAFEDALNRMDAIPVPQPLTAGKRRKVLRNLRRAREIALTASDDIGSPTIARMDEVIEDIESRKSQARSTVVLTIDRVGTMSWWSDEPDDGRGGRVSFTPATRRQAMAALLARDLLVQWGASPGEITTTTGKTWSRLAAILSGDRKSCFQYLREIRANQQKDRASWQLFDEQARAAAASSDIFFASKIGRRKYLLAQA